jgi:selenocysteine-specific elongation factor
LAIDRAFLLPGPGLVVTGTVAAGQVQAGAHLVLTPPGLPVRVRGIRAQDRAVGAATAGDRAALNIVGQGLSRDMVARGQWLVDPGLHAPTDRIDTLVRLLPAAERELRTGTRVHLHIGAAAIMASVAPLAERKLPAGQQGLVQLVTAEPIGALAGDRFVLRDEDARVTIGGGRVIDPWAPARGRSRPERLAFLSADQARAPDAALAALLEAAPDGLPLTPFARRRNRDLTEVRRLAEGMGAHVVGADPVAVSDAAWRRLLGEVLDAAGRVAGASPGRGTITPADLARGLGRRLPAPILGAAVDTLVADAKLERVGPDVRLPGQRASLSTADQALWQRLEPLLAEARPAATPDLAKRLSVDARRVELLVRRMLATGRLVRISDRRVIARARLIDLAQLAEALAAEPFGLQPGAFRDRSGLGRNFAIEVLEYFDRIGFTRRQGEGRRVLKRAADALAPQREAG